MASVSQSLRSRQKVIGWCLIVLLVTSLAVHLLYFYSDSYPILSAFAFLLGAIPIAVKYRAAQRVSLLLMLAAACVVLFLALSNAGKNHIVIDNPCDQPIEYVVIRWDDRIVAVGPFPAKQKVEFTFNSLTFDNPKVSGRMSDGSELMVVTDILLEVMKDDEYRIHPEQVVITINREEPLRLNPVHNDNLERPDWLNAFER